MAPTRSVAKADVAELTAALDSAVNQEKEHHLVIVGTNKVLSTTQFKQMFYARGDDFFQIANCYECPDSCNSVHSSVWGIDCEDPHDPEAIGAAGLVTMAGDRLVGTALLGTGVGYTIQKQECFNFNKLGGRENDPNGCAWAYSYSHDQDRNFYAQHEVMGYLEKDTCVKRDFWTACSRMSIEDQLYGLAFASETDQDLCMAVTCARRWSEVEDALAESCAAADKEIRCPEQVPVLFTARVTFWPLLANTTVVVAHPTSGLVIWTMTLGSNIADMAALVAAINATANGTVTGHSIALRIGWYHKLPTPAVSAGANELKLTLVIDLCDKQSLADVDSFGSTWAIHFIYTYEDGDYDGGTRKEDDGTIVDGGSVRDAERLFNPSSVDLYINVRVSNGHPNALDTILRVRFTVAYANHEPSALHTWNIRSSVAASGVIETGVVGDAPEGGKEQHEDTTVVSNP